MDVTFLKPLYDRPGPFASAYLDLRRSTEDTPKVIDLRWRALQRELTEQGAPPETIEAIERVVEQENRRRESGTLAVFASGGEVVHYEVPAGDPRVEMAVYAPLPHVKPMLAQRGDAVAYLVVVVDRLGGELRCVSRDGGSRTIKVRAEEEFPVRKTKAGDMFRQDKQQRAAEEVWHANAKKVGQAVTAAADDYGADVVVLAGDVRARNALQEELAEPVPARVVDAGVAGPALEEKVARAVKAKRDERITAMVGRFDQELTNHRRAAHGVEAVADALVKSQVACLLLDDRPESRLSLWVGPQPTDVATSAKALRERGVAEPVEDLADAALIRALAGTDGELLLVPAGSLNADSGVGALLRYTE